MTRPKKTFTDQFIIPASGSLVHIINSSLNMRLQPKVFQKFSKGNLSIVQDELGSQTSGCLKPRSQPQMHIQAHLGQSKDHFLEILKSHFRCNFLFREELMMCTNDPEAGRNYCSRRFFIFRVKNDQIHQKIDLGAVLALDAKRRMRATIFEKKHTFLKSKISEINL